MRGPDLSGVAPRVTAFLEKYLRRKGDINGQKQKKAFTGSDEALDALISWLQTQSNTESRRRPSPPPTGTRLGNVCTSRRRIASPTVWSRVERPPAELCRGSLRHASGEDGRQLVGVDSAAGDDADQRAAQVGGVERRGHRHGAGAFGDHPVALGDQAHDGGRRRVDLDAVDALEGAGR
jgi:hypothetical protein